MDHYGPVVLKISQVIFVRSSGSWCVIRRRKAGSSMYFRLFGSKRVVGGDERSSLAVDAETIRERSNVSGKGMTVLSGLHPVLGNTPVRAN